MTGVARGWDVLLIGGPSGAGKSRLAAELARMHEVQVVEVDDLHAAVLAMTTPGDRPVLHLWTTAPDPFALSEPEIADLHRAVSLELAAALHAVVSDRVGSDRPAIVEGDYLLPEVAARIVAEVPRVSALFVVEASAGQLAANLAAREPAAGDQSGRARIGAALGARIEADCARLGIPCLPARPWRDLPGRALAAVAGA